MLGNIRKNSIRKSLQSLQPSADDLHLLVPSPITINRNGKEITKTLNDTFKIPKSDEKENVAGARRSKRKNTNLGEQLKMTESKEDIVPLKTAKSKSSKASKKKTAVAKKSEKKMPDANQTNLDIFVTKASKSNNEIEPSTSIEDTAAATAVYIFKDETEEVKLLTSDTPLMSYWRDLAEQRMLALEKTLYENAQLTDQLEVLQADNMQLKSTLEEAEKVLRIVNAAL